MFGPHKFLAIYLGAGVIGNAISLLLRTAPFSLGSSVATYGLMGALGAYYVVNRKHMGPASAMGKRHFEVYTVCTGRSLMFMMSATAAGLAHDILASLFTFVTSLYLLPALNGMQQSLLSSVGYAAMQGVQGISQTVSNMFGVVGGFLVAYSLVPDVPKNMR